MCYPASTSIPLAVLQRFCLNRKSLKGTGRLSADAKEV
jgi:hypothetical protein